ncbi:MAG: hypothetical protein AAGD14_02645 [Planctomycetota bacterium]
MRLSATLLLLAACQQIGPYEEPRQPTPEEPPPDPIAEQPQRPLPGGFTVTGDAVREAASLGPMQTWRRLKSRLTTLQADARREGRDLLVTFEPSVVHVTRPDGSRVSWELPVGLSLTVEITHVLIRADLTVDAFDAEALPIPSEDELKVLLATVTDPEQNTEEFLLVVKGGTAFRSMSSG